MPWPRGLSVNGRAASGLGAGATCPCRAGDLLQTSTVKRRIRVRMEGYRSPRNPKLATGHEEQVSLAAARRGMDWTCASASASQGFQLLKIRARWSQCLPTAEDSKAPLPLRRSDPASLPEKTDSLLPGVARRANPEVFDPTIPPTRRRTVYLSVPTPFARDLCIDATRRGSGPTNLFPWKPRIGLLAPS